MTKSVLFKLSGVEVAGWISGPDEGPLFLCLHGWLDNADSFWPLAQALPQLRLLAIDWPGHGLSSHYSEQAYYHFIDWSDVLYQLTEQLAEPVILLGHSMGALAAATFAAALPKRVLGLVQLEGFGPMAAPESEAVLNLQQSLAFRAKLRGTNRTTLISLQQALQAKMQACGDLSKENAKRLCLRNLEPVAAQLYRWRYDPKLRSFSPLRMSEAQAEAFMQALTMPVLAIIATKGAEFVVRDLESRRKLVADLTLKRLDGGHHLHMSSAPQVAQVICQWLKNSCKISDS